MANKNSNTFLINFLRKLVFNKYRYHLWNFENLLLKTLIQFVVNLFLHSKNWTFVIKNIVI
jgi:hypothetical protein